MPIDKTYNPVAVEAKLYERWEQSGAFACDPNSRADPWCIMMPPPNVTGSLHMGHALNFTLQDILARYYRMQGRDVLWQPGTDHAGIATQMMVEKQLVKEGKNMGRREMGRAKFLERVWQWKKESGDTITRQLRRLGASCDWSRERFTMDPDLNKGVILAFVQMYREKLIYKDKRLVNWDPQLLTAVSDLEVEPREVKGNMWHFKYPVEGAQDEFITIATTRPDTLPSDVAVAVHPKDERYKNLVGKKIRHPIHGKLIPIIADEVADPEMGSGALKISPGHDFHDFEVGRRHKLPMVNIFDEHAKTVSENSAKHLQEFLDWVPQQYRGLDRFEARKRIVADMEAKGLLEKIEPHTHTVPYGDRSGVVIEPWLSEQWYCDAKTLAEPAIKAVEEGRTKFVPEQWTNTYYAWMRNIEPWCISRQLWWGHQIPAWYGPDGKIFVAETEEAAKAEAQKHYGKAVDLKQDEDVLDTWFSSGLWPASTIGWPQDTPELKRYYPTDVLVTGFDIIFFWVARMMMMCMHVMKDAKTREGKDWVPFKDVYIHALVRDEKGQKMSKTKGNVIDPLDIIDKYGCDALRFTLANMSTPGRDIKLATGRIEGNRNFVTKLWNATRYCEMNQCKWDEKFDPTTVKQAENKWIVEKIKQTTRVIGAHLEAPGTTINLENDNMKLESRLAYRFDLSSAAAYEFVWNTFCDWYLEFTKPVLNGRDEAAKAETRATIAWVLVQILHVLHPFMPFVTEEIWDKFTGSREMLMSRKWPVIPVKETKENLPYMDYFKVEIEWLIKIISTIRGVRSQLNVPAAARIRLQVKNADKKIVDRLYANKDQIYKMAMISEISHVDGIPSGSVQVAMDDIVLILPLADVIDLDQERARLGKESDKWVAEIKKIENKLANKDFVDRAPPEVVEEHRERKAEAEAMLAKLQAAQKSLAG